MFENRTYGEGSIGRIAAARWRTHIAGLTVLALGSLTLPATTPAAAGPRVASSDKQRPGDGKRDDRKKACARYLGGDGPASAWVYVDKTGALAYRPLDARGDRIMDFSSAGYGGGGVAIPTVASARVVKPSGEDDTAAIQAAIDAVSRLPLRDGFRGAVMLAPGTFTLAGKLTISTGGVVLRGSGTGPSGTAITVIGAERRVLDIRGSGVATAEPGAAALPITDAYVPSGATTLHVHDARALSVGDPVLVQRPVTESWVRFMGMDKLVRDGKQEIWIPPGTLHPWERTVTAIHDDEITFDIPISDSIDQRQVTPPGATVVKAAYPGRITHVGLEDFRIVAPVRAKGSEFWFIRIEAVADGWVRGVAAHDFTNGIWLGRGVKRFTIEDTHLTHDPAAYVTSKAPFDFSIDGQQTLVDRSSSQGGNKIWYYATQNAARGPNVLLNFRGTGTASHVASHDRWATGLLVDGSSVDGGIKLGNNGNLGDGQGWTMGWGVVWNSGSDVRVEAPPGATNWAIGVTGSAAMGAGRGIYDSLNRPVVPKSLYLAQLCLRRGPQVVAALGY